MLNQEREYVVLLFDGKRKMGQLVTGDRARADISAAQWNQSAPEHNSFIEVRLRQTAERLEPIPPDQYLTQGVA